MGTDIRDYGDRRHVVVHTDEQRVLSRLRSRLKCLRVIFYERAAEVIAADLYFPKTQEPLLRSELNLTAAKPKREITPAFAEARQRSQFRPAQQLRMASQR